MPLKLSSTGGGSVTIDAPSTASAFTLIVPASNANIIAFASGTAMIFNQTSAPTGWTKVTTHNDKALRIVSGSVSTGGSVAFSTAFASQAVSGTVGNTTLSTSQIPAHAHSFVAMNQTPATLGANAGGNIYAGNTRDTANAGGGGSHNHSFTGTAIDLAVSYVDVIIATVD